MAGYVPYGNVNKIVIDATSLLPQRTCYDVYAGQGQRKDTEDKIEFFKDVLKNNGLLEKWIDLAYKIFESKEDSYWNHSGKSWDKNFGTGGNYMDLKDCLLNKRDRTSGDDVHMSTGLSYTNSLQDVEQKTGGIAQQLINRKLKANSFIGRAPIDGLHENSTQQDIFYTLAGFRDRYGKTFQFGYTVFGLAFYNFRLKVISDGTAYNTAIGNRTVEEAIKDGGIQGFTYRDLGTGESAFYSAENKSSEEVTQTVTTSVDVSETESNSITNSKEYSYTESIGLSVELEDILKISKVAMQMQFEASQVIGTAYGKENSMTKEQNRSSSVSVVLPPHTVIAIIQKDGKTQTTLRYDCPIMVQFDVAVFSICGTCYDDNAAVHTFNTAGYDQRSFVTLFQSGNAGEDASENLYMRWNNKDLNGYDEKMGFTSLKSHNNGSLCKALNWSADEEEIVMYIAKNRPMSVTGATLTEENKSLSTTIKDIVAIYALKTVKMQVGNNSYDVGTNDVLYLDNWVTQGYDADGIVFYGYDHSKGEWILVDENGKKLEDDSIAVIKKDQLTGATYIQGKKKGTVYAKYLISDNYYTCEENTKITNETIQTAYVKIMIHESELKGSIKVNGNVEIKNNTIMNLENLNTLNVKVYDENGKEITVPVLWEIDQTNGNGIMILHNCMQVSKEGNYHIRARYEQLVSDWIEVKVTA